MPIFDRLGDAIDIETNLCRIALVLTESGDNLLAAELLGHTDTAFDGLGINLAWLAKIRGSARERVRVSVDDQEFAEAWSRGQGLSREDGSRSRLTP
jgi:hypothetical protein